MSESPNAKGFTGLTFLVAKLNSESDVCSYLLGISSAHEKPHCQEETNSSPLQHNAGAVMHKLEGRSPCPKLPNCKWLQMFGKSPRPDYLPASFGRVPIKIHCSKCSVAMISIPRPP